MQCQKVVDRFAKFSLSNPNNTSGLVGRCISEDDHALALIKPQLESHLSSLFEGAPPLKPRAVQVYLRPKNGNDVMVEASFCSKQPGDSSPIRYVGTPCEEPISADVGRQITDIMMQLGAAFSRTYPSINFRTRFIVDDNDQAWISAIFRFDRPGTSERAATSLSNNVLSKLQLDAELFTTAANMCSVKYAADTLPGLAAWRSTPASDGSALFTPDMSLYRPVATISEPELRFVIRASERFDVPVAHVQLINNCAGLLLGRAQVGRHILVNLMMLL